MVVEKPLVGAVPHGAHTGHPQGHVQQLGWNSLKDMEDTGTPCLRSSKYPPAWYFFRPGRTQHAIPHVRRKDTKRYYDRRSKIFFRASPSEPSSHTVKTDEDKPRTSMLLAVTRAKARSQDRMTTSMGEVWLATQIPSDWGRFSRLWKLMTAEKERAIMRKTVSAERW